MLVIKVYVTKLVSIREGESVEKGRTHHTELERIDEIQIQQVAKKGDGVREYAIIKPKGIKARISHVRDEGYRPLLERALALLGAPKRGSYKRRTNENKKI